MNESRILEKLDQLNTNLEIQKYDKKQINEIDQKIDDVKISISELKTIVEYEIIHSQDNERDIEIIKNKQDTIDLKIAEMYESLSFIKKICFIFLGVAFSLIAFLIKQYFTK